MRERQDDRGRPSGPAVAALVAAVLLAAGIAGGGPAAVATPAAASTPTRPAAAAFHHSIAVSLYPPNHSLRAVDSIYVTPEALAGGEIRFLVNRSLLVETVTSTCPISRWYTLEEVDPILFKAQPDSVDLEFMGRARGLFIKLDPAAARGDRLPIVIKYSGVIADSLEAPSKDYARGFETTTGLIDTAGVYLSSESLWYPIQFDRMVTFRMKVDVPPGWKAVGEGALASEGATKVEGADGIAVDRTVNVWSELNPTPEIYLVAGRYFTHEDRYAGDGSAPIRIMTYTYEPSDSLCQVYIDATKRYLALYGGLIGPYPWPKFALVENFWQTGYGMPSFTLLGSRVIRLPFIVNTSYGHEILHNWWGNSVYVDYNLGNWCEGLTAYGADYLYKERASADQAREYRHQTLVAFNDYVTERKDFPLSEFLERSDAATQSVGYGKSLMVYHMLRRSLGDSVFWAGLRGFYAQYKFKTASWDDLAGAFEKASGRDLGWFFGQWVSRPGAPLVSLGAAERAEGGGGHRVSFTLKQMAPPFVVDLPVRIETTHGTEDFTVRLAEAESTYSIETRSEPLTLAIDPDFDVFRRLYLEEVPLTLGGVFTQDSIPVVVGDREDEATRVALKEVAASWGLDANLFDESTGTYACVAGSHAWLLGRGEAFDRLLAPLKSQIEITDKTVRLGDSTYVLEGNTLVAAVRNPYDDRLGLGLVVTQDPESFKRLAARLPHYSSYSYLVFEKDKAVARGVWKERRSPLRVDFRER
jgi:aminopeptidase N